MPTKKPTIKQTISLVQLNIELKKLFESGNTGKTDLLGLISTKYKMGRDRYFKSYDIAYEEWQKTKEQATNDAIQANTIKGLESGLKSKLERQLEIQAEIEDLKRRLEHGKTKDVFIDFKKGLPKNYERDLTPSEIAMYKRTLAILNVELSKMAGEYAPTKTAQTDTKGNDVPTTFVTKVIGVEDSEIIEKDY